MKTKNVMINFIASGVVFAVGFVVNFFLSPFIVENIGEEAYGFYNLGNQFISYATIVTLALNSMAGKFVTISLHKGEENQAKKYFNSVLFGNVLISIVLFLISFFLITKLQNFLHISNKILTDVKLLWSFLSAAFIIGLLFSVFSIAAFASNKIYLNSISTVLQNILKAGMLVVLYAFFTPALWYLGLTSVVCAIIAAVIGLIITHKLLPDFCIRKEYFDISSIKQLVTSGGWNSLTQLAGVLNNGLDLLLTNLYISPAAMGIMSIAKTIPSYLSQFNATFVSAFVPQITISYACGEREGVLRNIAFCHKVMTLVLCIPSSIMVVYGKDFFALWMPSINSNSVQMISMVTLCVYFILGPISALNEVITITNKHKMIAITYTTAGVINIVLVAFLLRFLSVSGYNEILGVDIEIAKMMVVAGISSLIGVVRNMLFTPIYAAYCLKERWTCFYPMIGKGLLCTLLSILFSWTVHYFGFINSWFQIFSCFIISAAFAGVSCVLILFEKKERLVLWKIILNKLGIRTRRGE